MVETYFKSIMHPIYFGKVYDEAKELEKAYRLSLLEGKAEIIAVQILLDGMSPESFSSLTVESKARYFEFDMTDNKQNLELYSSILFIIRKVWKLHLL